MSCKVRSLSHKFFDLVGPAIKDSIHRGQQKGELSALVVNWVVSGLFQIFDPIVECTEESLFNDLYSGNVSNEMLKSLIDFVELYQVDVRPEKVYKIEEIQEAHTYLESSHSFGKVIVKN